MNAEVAEQVILDDILACGGCCDIGGLKKNRLTGLERIEYLKKNLPLLDYVLNQTVYYIFSNGLTTGDTESSNRLKAWLDQKNINGDPNLLTLKAGIKSALVDGCCGLRVYENNLYKIERGYYATLTQRIDGIEQVVGFLIRSDGKLLRDKIELKKDYETLEEIMERFERNKLILLDKSNFICLRNDTSSLFGDSPLLRDEQRLSLLLS